MSFRNILLIFFWFGSICNASAQKIPTKTQIIFTTDTVYFDQDWEQTELEEDRKYSRIIKRTSDGKPYGTVRDFYYPSWKKQWEGKLLSETPDVAIGFCTYWYPNGKIQSSGTYVKGAPQADLQMWKQDGKKVICKTRYVESLPLTKAKLLPYFNSGSSRSVLEVTLPNDALGLVYRIDIRDEGQPPVGWSTVAALTAASLTGGTSAMLLAGAKAMDAASAGTKAPIVSTKSRFYITTSSEDVQYFYQSKGSMPTEHSCIGFGNNITYETKQLVISPGTKKVYFCLNNDNYQTSALATLNVAVLQKQCN